MVRETQGIEIFGRNASTIDTSSRARVPRSAALGASSIALAVLAAIAFVGAVIERAVDDPIASVFVVVALAASALAMLAGVAAVLTGRGGLSGFVGVVMGAASNPWVLGLVLAWLAELPTE